MSIDGESLKQLHSKPLLIVTAICLAAAIWFGYLWSTSLQRKDVNFDAEIAEYKKLHRDELSQFQIQCNNEIMAIRKECRTKLDSIENDYFAKFSKQERQIMKIENQLDAIKNKLPNE